MSEPRYVVRETTGYPIHAKPQRGGGAPFTEIQVYDSWYCYRPVWRPTRRSFSEGVARRRIRAARVCAELNAQHEAWERGA